MDRVCSGYFDGLRWTVDCQWLLFAGYNMAIWVVVTGTWFLFFHNIWEIHNLN